MNKTYSTTFFTKQKINRPPTPTEMSNYMNNLLTNQKKNANLSLLVTPEYTYKEIMTNEPLSTPNMNG